jgi:zinc transport system permease protein
LSHSSLAVGLVVVAFLSWLRIDLVGYLFGDVLAISRADIALIYAGGALVLAALMLIWRPLLALTVNEDLARAEGVSVLGVRIAFMLLISIVIALAMKVVGILLITSLLIIPAATARRFAATPEAMAAISALVGAVAVLAGLCGSLTFDTPSGPSIVVAALALFLLSLVPLHGRQRA